MIMTKRGFSLLVYFMVVVFVLLNYFQRRETNSSNGGYLSSDTLLTAIMNYLNGLLELKLKLRFQKFMRMDLDILC